MIHVLYVKHQLQDDISENLKFHEIFTAKVCFIAFPDLHSFNKNNFI